MEKIMSSSVQNYDKALRKKQDELAVDYLPAVRKMAYKLKERLPSSIDVNDLISIGVEELVKLSRRYDSSLNDSFWGYGKKRVQGSMLDYLRSLDTISRGNRKLVKQIEDITHRYYNEHEEEPTEEYIAKQIGEDVKKIRDAKLASEIYNVMPLEEQLAVFEGSTQPIIDKLQTEELLSKVENVLFGLNEREQKIVQLYYYEELSLKEISEILDITQSRISQILKSVTIRIRKKVGDVDG
jgi:RNA polymerase sigma factor for flagellar operon FliA